MGLRKIAILLIFLALLLSAQDSKTNYWTVVCGTLPAVDQALGKDQRIVFVPGRMALGHGDKLSESQREILRQLADQVDTTGAPSRGDPLKKNLEIGRRSGFVIFTAPVPKTLAAEANGKTCYWMQSGANLSSWENATFQAQRDTITQVIKGTSVDKGFWMPPPAPAAPIAARAASVKAEAE